MAIMPMRDKSEAACAGRSSDSSGETITCAAVACILLHRGRGGATDLLAAPAWERAQEDELRLCQQVSARVEILPLTPVGSGALLDLGHCSSEEARGMCAQALARLAQQGFSACAGAGATLTVAQLAALTAPACAAQVIPPAQGERFLQQTSVALLEPLAALASLSSTDATRITAEVIARLQRYGLQTLGQVARLDRRDPQALRRQFGGAVGACLATLAQGGALRPLRPTPMPASVSARLRCSSGFTLNQAFTALPTLAERLAQQLTAKGRQGRDLRLRVVWESGGDVQGQRRLARPLCQPREIAQVAHSLLTALLATPDATVVTAGDARACDAVGAVLVAFTVTLGDLSAQPPVQPSPLFATPDAHLAQGEQQEEQQAKRLEHRLERIAREVAEPLARRYGAPALYRLTTSQPDAILPEERAQLVRLTVAQREQRQLPATARTPGRAPGRACAPRALEDGVAGGVRPPQPHWW